MIGDFFINFFYGVLIGCPVLALPVGFIKALDFLSDVVGVINVFVPVLRIAPILAFVIMVRNWNIFVSILRFVLRFIPFLSGG